MENTGSLGILKRGENVTTTEELNYLKAMIEVSYRPRIIKVMVMCGGLSDLSVVSLLISMVLVVITMNSSQAYMMVSTGWFVGSLVIFVWSRIKKDEVSRLLSLLNRIEGLDDPSELVSIDPVDYGFERVDG